MTSATGPQDSQLMARLQAGDREAFGCLVDRHKDMLVGYLTRLTGSLERAEDLAQETFLRLYERSDRYIEQGKLPAYLFRIAVNLLRDEERRGRRWLFLSRRFLPRNGHRPPDQHDRVLRVEVQERVSGAIAELAIHHRVPLVLHELEGWSYRDIAAHLGCREGTVKSRIHRARKVLREKLEPYWRMGEPT